MTSGDQNQCQKTLKSRNSFFAINIFIVGQPLFSPWIWKIPVRHYASQSPEKYTNAIQNHCFLLRPEIKMR